MGKLHLAIAVLVLLTSNTSVFAKSIGSFKSYKQVTDKEILIESTNGSKILVSAYNNYAIGISSLEASSNITLTSPKSIAQRTDLNGSIYVEELDELMQITTTVEDGLIIKIEKNPLRFSYIKKSDSNTLFEELSGVKFGSKSNDLNLAVDKGEELKIISSNYQQSNILTINNGDIIRFDRINTFIYPDNEICLISSKGYAIVFDSEIEHEINYSKPEKIKISTTDTENNQFSFLLIYGQQQPELIEKYAFHMTHHDNQISLK